jgi:predicted metalloprotease
MQTTPPPAPAFFARLRALAPLTLAALVAALAAGWVWGRLEPPEPPPLRASGAESIVRRTEIAFADAEAVWRRSAAGRAAGYRPAKLAYFTRATATGCAGGATVSGPFYCPETGTASFDLGFLDAFGTRLDRERDLALTLYAVRIAAEHLQRELGLLDVAALELIGARRGQRREIGAALALQADCLTGAWAAAAAPRIGSVPEALYDRMVWSARNLVADLGQEGLKVPPGFDAFAAAPREARAAAFRRGQSAGGIAGCLTAG